MSVIQYKYAGSWLAWISSLFLLAHVGCARKRAESSPEVSNKDSIHLSDECADPDLSKIATDVVVALCDGRRAQGTLAIRECTADGEVDCYVRGDFKAAEKSQISSPVISQGMVIAGVKGTGSAAAEPSCSSEGQVGCRIVSPFVGVEEARVTPARLRVGVAVLGVVGQYPSVTYRLAAATGINDLTSATLNASLQSGAAVEWFSSEGIRHTATGDTAFNPGNIASGVTLFGVTGSYGGGVANCAADGETGCITTLRYKAMDTDSSVIDAWDIRAGRTAGGIVGKLAYYKNMADLVTYNATSAPASSSTTVPDPFDAIDDRNDTFGAFPSAAVPGWPQATGANWTMHAASDSGIGGGTAGDGLCNGAEDCVFQDRITTLLWSKQAASTATWSDAISYCDTLSYGGFVDWRLPTQKELGQAYVDGIFSQTSAVRLGVSSLDHWSATTSSNATANAYRMDLSTGEVLLTAKTSSYRVLCVRSP